MAEKRGHKEETKRTTNSRKNTHTHTTKKTEEKKKKKIRHNDESTREKADNIEDATACFKGGYVSMPSREVLYEIRLFFSQSLADLMSRSHRWTLHIGRLKRTL